MGADFILRKLGSVVWLLCTVMYEALQYQLQMKIVQERDMSYSKCMESSLWPEKNQK